MKPNYSIILFAFLIASCKHKPETAVKNAKDGPVLVDVIVANPQTIVSKVEANGTVVANEYVELHPEVSGRLTYLNIPEGAYVQQGTVVARINDADLEAQLNKSKVALDLAVKTEERLRKLLAVNGVNQSDYDIALNAVNGYKADIAYTQSLIDKTIIKVPFSGIMGLRQVSPGAYLSPTSIIATVQQLDKIKIDFTLPEEYSNLIAKGNTVDVLIDATKQITRKAVIIAIEPQVLVNTRNLKVRAQLQDTRVNPGAYVKVYLTADRDKKGIFVPTNAIIPDDKNKQLVLVKNGKASFVNVLTGVRQADNVEVTNGIAAGDTIVVTGVLFARPKADLKVRSVKTLDELVVN
ncbi:MAG: efflux RND transporter periplasmic adaptor subunit [Bacteroidota bacterium]|nr:efflux RND transporter periplasmic adaptor subunit [Bacteroidota bacterium]